MSNSGVVSVNAIYNEQDAKARVAAGWDGHLDRV